MEPNTLTPSNKAIVLTQQGMVIVRTDDGLLICITPALARALAGQLVGASYLAEPPQPIDMPMLEKTGLLQ
jgi:hypothetical protein